MSGMRCLKLWLLGLFFTVISSGNAQVQTDTDPNAVFQLINSKADELNPLLTEDGTSLYFVRRFEPANTGGVQDPGDIWQSSWVDSLQAWGTPKKVRDPFNTPQLNGVIGFTPGGGVVYLYDHYPVNGAAARTQGLSYSYVVDGRWQEPLRLSMRYFYNRSDHESICLSSDGQVMILSLDSYGTMGNEDLYVSFNQGGNAWSEPKSLGTDLNTSFQEMTPSLASDNKTLFFASNGHGGFGGRDILVTQRLDDTWRSWSPPKNLGPEINSEGVELYFQYLPGEEIAIYSSTRNSDGYADFRMAKYPMNSLEELLESPLGDPLIASDSFAVPVIVENASMPDAGSVDSLMIRGGVVSSNDQSKLLDGFITVRNDQGWEMKVAATAHEGYVFTLPSLDVYSVEVESEGYVSRRENLDVRIADFTAISHNFVLQPIEIGIVVNLENVLFVQGSTELLESSGDELDLVVKMMNENPGMEIELNGHTDNRGNARLNKILSQQRVEAVIDYLSEHGIARSRLSGTGYGGEKPIASNEAEETRQLNRRVEFVIRKN